MGVRAKNKLTKSKRNKGRTMGNHREFRRGTNPICQLGSPAHPFLQLGLHGLFLRRKLQSTRINITKDGQKQLIGYIFQSHGDFTIGEEESVSGGTPSADKMVEIEKVPKVG